MKRIFSIFALILISVFTFNIVAAEKGAVMTFAEKTHDFGEQYF